MAEENWDEGQEVRSNWFKFEKVGDKIKGTLLNKRLQPSTQQGFPDQWVYELKDSEGKQWNVGISVAKAGTVQRLNNCKIGEVIGILFEKEGEPSKKGFAPAKFLKVLSFGMDAEYKEFEAEDEGEALPQM